MAIKRLAMVSKLVPGQRYSFDRTRNERETGQMSPHRSIHSKNKSSWSVKTEKQALPFFAFRVYAPDETKYKDMGENIIAEHI